MKDYSVPKINQEDNLEEVKIEIECRNNLPLKEELDNEIDNYNFLTGFQKQMVEQKTITCEIFKRELKLYFQTENLTGNISNIIQALKSIPGTSIECERNFSIVGMFLNKSEQLSERKFWKTY